MTTEETLAPPIAVGFTSSWRFTPGPHRKIVYHTEPDGSRPPVQANLYFYEIVRYVDTIMYMTVCDAISSGLLPHAKDDTLVTLVDHIEGFIDLDDLATLKMMKAAIFVKNRIVWLTTMQNHVLGVEEASKLRGGFKEYGETPAPHFNLSKMRMSGYYKGKLVTMWCTRSTGASVQKQLGTFTKPVECPWFRSPSNHLLRHGSHLALLTLVAAALAGGVAGGVQEFKIRRAMRESETALRQLSLMGDYYALDATGKRLALEASELLVPAAIVDEGATAIVLWIQSRDASWWKRYAPAAISAVAAALLWNHDTARSAAVHTSVALASYAMMRTGDARGGSSEHTGIRRHTVEARKSLLIRSDSIIRGLLKRQPAELRNLAEPQLRSSIIKVMPRVLELLFTDPVSGRTYSNEMVLRRLVLYPGLLRPQLYKRR